MSCKLLTQTQSVSVEKEYNYVLQTYKDDTYNFNSIHQDLQVVIVGKY